MAELLRVLIADDDADNASTLAIVLGLSGHQVELAADARAALEKLRQKLEPDVIILDLPFPIQADWDAARQFKKQKRRPPYVIAITDRDGYRGAAPPQGIDLHLTKPVDASSLDGILRDFKRP
jgi:CheY-like chemotaxis protein